MYEVLLATDGILHHDIFGTSMIFMKDTLLAIGLLSLQ